MKRILVTIIAAIMLFSSVNTLAYTVEDAFKEFGQKHPDFVTTVIKQGVSENLLIDFLKDVRDYMIEMTQAEKITESNFEEKAITAITRVSSREKFIVLQDALLALYPDDISQAVINNTVTPKFRPLVDTIKKIVFDNNMLDGTLGGEMQFRITFNDVSSDFWAYEAISELSNKNIINGYLDNTFKPEANITRAEFAKIIVAATNSFDYEAKCSLSDVKNDDWYYSYVASAMKMGYITGYPDGSFKPNNKITREDICTVVYRCIKDRLNKKDAADVFVDSYEISSYAKEAVLALYANGIINGMDSTTFAPKNHATRAQTAKIIYTAFFK